MKGYPKSTSQKCIEEMTRQMKNSIFKIYQQDGKYEIGIGFFCHLNYKKKNIPFSIINGLVENPEDIDTIYIFKNNVKREIKLGNIKYRNKELNLTILEVKENKRDRIHFFEIDDRAYKKNPEFYFDNDSIYIIQYSNIKNVQVSFGIIDAIINNSEFEYLGNVNLNSKGSLIFNLSNNKLIGIHKESCRNYSNKGFLFNHIIEGFIIQYKHNNNSNYEINILIKVDKKDINEKVYFLDNYGQNKNEHVNHDNLKEIELKSDIYINEVKYNFKRNYFIPEREGKYNIKLKFNLNLIDYSYMFAECHNIINIDFINFNNKNIINMQSMFYECKNLEIINIFSFNTRNVTNMNSMFYNCKNLKYLDLSSFDFKNATNMNYFLYNCKNYKNMDLSNFNFKNIDTNCFFYCNMTIIYNVDKNNDEIQIFNPKFVYSNKDKCYLIIDGKKINYVLQ